MKVTEQQAKETIKRAKKSRTEWAKLLGFHYLNGSVSKKLDAILERYNLDTSHFDAHHKKRKYKTIQKSCPICDKLFSTQENHSREKTVCSRSCSNIYFAKIRHTEKANKKTRQSMIQHAKMSGKYVKRKTNCIKCKKQFVQIRKSQKCCSQKCGALGRQEKNKKYHQKITPNT